jgi:hypothetical protein
MSERAIYSVIEKKKPSSYTASGAQICLRPLRLCIRQKISVASC